MDSFELGEGRFAAAVSAAVDDSGDLDAKIPYEELDPALIGPEDRFDMFFDLSAEIYDVFVDVAAQRRYGALARYWQLDDLVFCDAKIGPTAVRRTKQHINQEGSDCVLLCIAQGERSQLVFGDHVEALQERAFHLTDMSREHREISDSSNYRSVLLPHAAVGYDPGVQPPYMRVDLNTPQGRVLSTVFGSLHDQLPHVRTSEAAGLAAAFSGVIRGSFLENDEGGRTLGHYQAARSKAMRDFIELRLQDPDLGFAKMMQNFGVSRATLFRDFAADGGLEHYIYSRRLEKAYIDLANGPARRGRVAEVAERWRFSSDAHFCRRFRAAFGCQPGEILRLNAKRMEEEDLKDATERRDDFGQILAQAIRMH